MHLVVIINDYKTMWGNLEVPFVLWVKFNNVFYKKETRYNYIHNEISQKRNKNLTWLFPEIWFSKKKQTLKKNNSIDG